MTSDPLDPSPVPDGEPSRRARQVDFNATPAMLLSHLVKTFGAKVAVNDLSLAVPPGCLFGLVGPNGAGKTTTLSMVTGLLRPDQGVISVLGRDVWADPASAKALMGVLPDGIRLFDRLTGREMLMLTAQMRGVPAAVAAPRADALLEALTLTADATTLVADYSAGMTKKIGLACALIHNPSLVILDEPFESVDPVSGEAIRSILHDFVDRGGTVVMSSHVMELVETLCDAVAVIAEGRILALGGIEQVKNGEPLQQRFLELVGVRDVSLGSLSWLGQS
ncbi:MAG: ABC transporter ATP-binding protein [Propionibacteriaceae bacterium]|nr:ABC transporter ATP-binding protein [Propionibacteriaceae bacterium]